MTIEYLYECDKTGMENESIINEFKLDETDYRKNYDTGECIFNFVGLVIKDDKLLTVMPHNYNFQGVKGNLHSQVLFNTITKYLSQIKNDPKAKHYIGDKIGYKSNYPFSYFTEIYNYYTKYGLYKVEEKHYVDGYSGDISWKKTLQSNNIIVSNGNIIYSPFKVKKKNFIDEFITESMVFAINYTIERFSMFIPLPCILGYNYTIDFSSNVDFVIQELRKRKQRIFKDREKLLVDNLIYFYESISNKSLDGGDFHIKIKYYNYIWQAMVEGFLNKYFDGMGNEKISWDFNRKNHSKIFSEKYFSIDDSYHGFKIAPDHFYHDKYENTVYVFDSKYYKGFSDLNYKQFTYTFLLNNYYKDSIVRSAMLLPGKTFDSKFHVIVEDDYSDINMVNTISEQYLDVYQIMKSYNN